MTEKTTITAGPDRARGGVRVTRRRFLQTSAAAIAGLALPSTLWAIPRPDKTESGTLKFYNIHTAERLAVCYRHRGRVDHEAVQAINRILRDHRTDDIHPIDLRLLDLLHAIRMKAGNDSWLHVISGYRSPATNAKLRRNSAGVARKSLHMRGHAADIRIPGIRTADVRRIAIDLARGGVGYYPESDFVHVDIGRVRAW